VLKGIDCGVKVNSQGSYEDCVVAKREKSSGSIGRRNWKATTLNLRYIPKGVEVENLSLHKGKKSALSLAGHGIRVLGRHGYRSHRRPKGGGQQ